ncbi:MAG TPA: GNAT family N-acetyltransferase [Clostridiaceae bacterium]|nr:GNAT family N-acetyltransferase [Clostridiaceae bacterium]
MKLRWATKNDVPEMVSVIYDIWAKKEHYSCLEAEIVSQGFSYYYRNFDAYTDRRIVIAIEDNRIIGIAGILPFPMPNMPQVVGAMLNPVGVIAEYRGKGVGKACITFLFDALIQAGYHLVTVVGIPGYYPRLGFQPVFHKFVATFPVQNALILEGADEVVTADADTVWTVVEIFNKTTDKNLFKIQRDEEWVTRKFLHPEILEAYESGKRLPLGTLNLHDTYLSRREGMTTGYMVIGSYETALVIEEILGLDGNALWSLLRRASRIAQDKGLEKIIVNHAVPDGLTGTVLTDIGASITMSTPWHFMLKVLNPTGLLNSMQSIMEERLTASPYAGSSFQVNIKLDGIRIGVTANEGKLAFRIMDSSEERGNSRIELIPRSFAKLIAGQFSAMELYQLGYIRLEEASDIDLLTALFPKHFPYIFETDDN